MACPCGSYITEWRVWAASGKSSLMGDSDPLNGITATCSDGYVLQVCARSFSLSHNGHHVFFVLLETR